MEPTHAARSANTVGEHLSEAGWGPRDLARAANTWLFQRGRGGERVDVTAPYSWVRFGFCPHEPLPAVVADVLAERLGRHVHPWDLWPEHPRVRRNSSYGGPREAASGNSQSLEDT